jgi:guanylate kinase
VTFDDATRPDSRSALIASAEESALTTSNEARLTVLSGPSGVGKDSVIELIRARAPWVWLSVSVTTRRIRETETDGVHYHFVDRTEFERLASSGQLLEWAEFAGNLYGTPRGPVQARLDARPAGPLKIDLQGARQVRAAMPRPGWSSSPRPAGTSSSAA